MLVATGRWTGNTIEGCPAWLTALEGVLANLEVGLIEEERASLALVEASTRNAYNEEGVDVSLIDWMLGLSPLERLAVLQDAADSFPLARPADVDALP